MADKSLPKLMPDRHPNRDFFICDVLDAAPKDDLGSMEHPMFSLSKKPDLRVRRYEHRGNWVEITPSVKGLATIYDKDILIYCISQIVAKMNAGIEPSRTVRLTAYDLLVSTNRLTDGRAYERLSKAFERLAGTRLTTNIVSGRTRMRSGFGMIEDWTIIEKSPDDERMVAVEVTLSRWLYAAIQAREILSIDRDYFRLGKPIERRIYELARKHCGNQPRWEVSFDVLFTKSGSSSSRKEFLRALREIEDNQHLPGYRVSLGEKTAIFYNRGDQGRQRQVRDLLDRL